MKTKTEIIELESVGSVIQGCTVYAQNVDGSPDLETACSIDDCSAEWYAALSPSDLRIVRLMDEDELAAR